MSYKNVIPYQYNDKAFLIRKIKKNFNAESINELPHRHGFYEIIYVQKGKGIHVVDDVKYKLERNTIYYISKGKVHQFISAKNLDAYLIRFQDSILPSVNSEKEGFYYNLLQSISHIIEINLDERDDIFAKTLIHRMSEEYDGQNISTVLDLSMIQHLLYPLLILMHKQIIVQFKNEGHGKSDYLRFTNLLELNYKGEHGLEYYSKKLGISKRQLSNICLANTGKTAKQLINDRLVLEGKRLIKYTKLSIKEISNRLGFKDDSYFCRRFKTATSITPSQFKKV